MISESRQLLPCGIGLFPATAQGLTKFPDIPARQSGPWRAECQSDWSSQNQFAVKISGEPIQPNPNQTAEQYSKREFPMALCSHVLERQLMETEAGMAVYDALVQANVDLRTVSAELVKEMLKAECRHRRTLGLTCSMVAAVFSLV